MEQQSERMIAEVLISSPVPHLDRTFDYLVPPTLAAQAQYGMRVKVRFGASDRDGFILGLRKHTDFTGELKPIRAIVGEIPVLTPELMEQWQAIAHWYGGIRSDILRLAIPPRHARAEKASLAALETTREPEPVAPLDFAAWETYNGGPAFLRRLASGQSPRAVWTALPSPDPYRSIVEAAKATLQSGRSVIVVAATASEVAHLSAQFDAQKLDHSVLTAAAGPHARYRRYIDAITGQTQIVIGTRSAVFAPVTNLGLIVCWDDGNTLLREQRAPYPHVRDIARIRAQFTGACVLIGGYNRTSYAHEWVLTGWAASLSASRDKVRALTPRVHAIDDLDRQRDGGAGWARIPPRAHRLIATSLESGPVLIHVPRRGYVPVVSCESCGQVARCTNCHGPIQLRSGGQVPQCTWCAALQGNWRCAHCQASKLRARRIGSSRTAEELGRAFPETPVLVSASDEEIIAEIDGQPRLVIATPGAEPRADGGYQALVILDSHATTSHPHIDSTSEALRRWLYSASLVKPQGQVLVTGLGDPVPIQALVRWDPIGFTEREFSERIELKFPPTVRMARIEGEQSSVEAAAKFLGPHAEIVGVFHQPDGGKSRLLVRVPLQESDRLTTQIQYLQAARSAKKTADVLQITLDPISL